MANAEDPLSRPPDDRVQVLAPDGRVVGPDLLPDLDDETLVSMYRDMRLARRFDERAVNLQRQGRLGTYPPMAGQEGAQIGSTYALAEADLVSYQYREHGVVVARGFPRGYLSYWAGHARGNDVLADLNVLPLNIGVGSHLPHAVGLAWGAEYRGDDRVAVVHFGDGATSEGDFHEALNFAGVFDLPVLFVCNNNGWAISHPAEHQTASDTIAGKAAAYGIDGVQVDGMDPLATYAVVAAAREKARTGAGGPRPTLIEAVQYRFGAHTTADDPERYREPEEVEEWRERDPLVRFEAYLRETGRLDDERDDAIGEEIEEALAEAVAELEAAEADPEELFAHAYAELPPGLVEQRAGLRRLLERHGEGRVVEED